MQSRLPLAARLGHGGAPRHEEVDDRREAGPRRDVQRGELRQVHDLDFANFCKIQNLRLAGP